MQLQQQRQREQVKGGVGIKLVSTNTLTPAPQLPPGYALATDGDGHWKVVLPDGDMEGGYEDSRDEAAKQAQVFDLFSHHSSRFRIVESNMPLTRLATNLTTLAVQATTDAIMRDLMGRVPTMLPPASPASNAPPPTNVTRTPQFLQAVPPTRWLESPRTIAPISDVAATAARAAGMGINQIDTIPYDTQIGLAPDGTVVWRKRP